MFKEILQIVPKLAPGDLNNMERSLGRRFTRIAKRFGKGLASVLKGGGVLGLAVGLIDKIVNPLKETQEAIDKLLKRGDDVVTNAKQFGTTAGKLFRLQQIGKSAGLEDRDLDFLITKFQTAVAEAAVTPDTARARVVSNFVGSTDIVDAFTSFIGNLQNMTQEQRQFVQYQVFGERLILKMADFLQTDLAKQNLKLGGPTAAELNPALEKSARLNDQKDFLSAQLELNDTMNKSRAVNEEMVRLQHERNRLELERQNDQIKNYKALADISNSTTEILNLAKQAVLGITSMITRLTNLSENVKKLSESRVIKGFLKFTGGK